MNPLEKTVESVLSKMEADEREREIEQLLQANAELLTHNKELKQQLKAGQNPDQTAS